MLDIMYDIPKDDNIGTVTITGDYINKKGAPIITVRQQNNTIFAAYTKKKCMRYFYGLQGNDIE